MRYASDHRTEEKRLAQPACIDGPNNDKRRNQKQRDKSHQRKPNRNWKSKTGGHTKFMNSVTSRSLAIENCILDSRILSRSTGCQRCQPVLIAIEYRALNRKSRSHVLSRRNQVSSPPNKHELEPGSSNPANTPPKHAWRVRILQLPTSAAERCPFIVQRRFKGLCSLRSYG